MGLSSFFKNLFDSAKETANEIATKAEIAAEEAKIASTPYLEKAESIAGETIEKVKETTAPIIEKAEKVTEETIEKVKEAVTPITEKVEEYVEQAKEALDEYSDKAGEILGDVLESLKSDTAATSEKTQILIEEVEITTIDSAETGTKSPDEPKKKTVEDAD